MITVFLKTFESKANIKALSRTWRSHALNFFFKKRSIYLTVYVCLHFGKSMFTERVEELSQGDRQPLTVLVLYLCILCIDYGLRIFVV